VRHEWAPCARIWCTTSFATLVIRIIDRSLDLARRARRARSKTLPSACKALFVRTRMPRDAHEAPRDVRKADRVETKLLCDVTSAPRARSTLLSAPTRAHFGGREVGTPGCKARVAGTRALWDVYEADRVATRLLCDATKARCAGSKLSCALTKALYVATNALCDLREADHVATKLLCHVTKAPCARSRLSFAPTKLFFARRRCG
jgi:hypothetical protein